MIKIDRPDCPNEASLNSGNYKHKDNKDALIEANSGKCMYCESQVTHTYYGDVEHIKPKSKYPDLEFKWSNLGYVCAKCNGAKSDNFEEDTPYVNPYDDEPSDHIVSSGTMMIPKQGSERGEITILDIGLNRPGLIERRADRRSKIISTLNSCYKTTNKRLKDHALNALRKEADNDKEYSLCVRAILEVQEVM
ncbi:MAG: HNH endonuclease [SAR324 cluster bacterium]|nr:HNH endonuclease [SAR324 cluster bacterium]